MDQHIVLGVDVGGSGIKGAPVDVRTGEMLAERIRLETPKPSTPQAVAATFAELASMFNWKGLIGCGFPAIVKNNVAYSAANIHEDWVGVNIADLFSAATGCPVAAINDADAAGMAVMNFGIGKGVNGTVLIITIGTGLGSALFLDGKLVPDTEFGHLFFKGMIAEHYCSDSARKKLGLSWEEWGRRFNEYLLHLERLLAPDLIILGGGGSKQFNAYSPFLTLETTVKPAFLQNHAGTIGAAYNAWQQYTSNGPENTH